MAFYGYCVLVLAGMTYQTAIHHTRHVIDAFSNGSSQAYLKRY